MKNYLTKQMLLILLAIGSTTFTFAQAWQRVGKQFGTAPYFNPSASGTYYSPALAFSSKNNVLYTAFINAGTTPELVVMQSGAFGGNPGKISWTKTGSISTPVGYTAPSLTINPITEEPYVCVISKKNEYVVQKFDLNSNTWNQVGTIKEEAIEHYLPVLAFKPGTEELYISFIYNFNGNNVVVKKFDGISWNTVGNNSIGNATNAMNINSRIKNHSCSLAFNPSNNEAYIGFINNSGYLTVKNLSSVDNNWYDFGILSSFGQVSTISGNALAFNPVTNMPYLAYSILNPVYGNLNRIIKAKIGKSGSGIFWTDVKSDSLKLGNVASTLAFAPNTEITYVTGFNTAGGVFLVKKFTGTTWDYLGYTYCNGITNPVPSIGPSCGYNNSAQMSTLLFNTNTGKAFLAYPNELTSAYEVRMEP